MKYFFLLVIAGLMTVSGLYLINKQSVTTIDVPVNNRLAEKHEPSDEFFMQRANSDGTFSIKAYEQGLKAARMEAQARGGVDGFDEDWTVQGPGNIGARINTIAVDPLNEDVIYVGFSGGGVFKTTDGGANWSPIFDDQTFLAIGDIHIDPNDNQTVYVGTGDPNISGYPKVGDGVYKSTDAGATWSHIGLTDQRIISEIIIDPSDSDLIYVGTMGLPFERNNDRGLYRSQDGGTNWEQVLFISDSTGIIDIVMDPFDSQVLYAAGWDRIRNNTESLVSGLGAKVFKTTDGGDNWTMVEGGLPNADPHSRVGLAISHQTPGVVFVQYADPSSYQLEAIYRTNNAGTSWTEFPMDEYSGLSGNALGGFGWYFGKIRVNPENDDDLYMLGVDLWRTLNNGSTWSEATPPWWEYSVHADKHDLLFLPSGKILLATDGGLYKADANGSNWEDIENIPTTQFYRVAYNPHIPDFYYGGAQDNGSTGGNADIINEWPRIYGGDGFQMAFDPNNEDRFFAETQRGGIVVTTDGGNYFESATYGISQNDSRNWDMPYIISPHDPQVLYAGTDKIYQGFGDIPFFGSISTDLTDGPEEEHRYHNITTLNESILEQGLLYVGTGDGKVWRGNTNDNVWVEISNGLPDQYVTDIVPSPDITNNVYVSFSGYRDNDNLPRLHRSADRGASWEDISAGLPNLAINDVLVLPTYSDSLIFVATDGGVYGTLDAGENWNRVGANMPFILVFDMVHNVARNEIVAGTFARSIMSFPIDSLITEPEDSVSSVRPPLAVHNDKLKVFPSPATDHITVSIDNIEPNREMEIAILDASGRLLKKETWAKNEKQRDFNINDWPTGQYYIKVKMRHEVQTGQFVKIN